jgi:hypothetical protein
MCALEGLKAINLSGAAGRAYEVAYLDDAVQGEAEALMEIRQPLAVCDAVQAKGKSGREDSKIPVDL